MELESCHYRQTFLVVMDMERKKKYAQHTEFFIPAIVLSMVLSFLVTWHMAEMTDQIEMLALITFVFWVIDLSFIYVEILNNYIMTIKVSKR